MGLQDDQREKTTSQGGLSCGTGKRFVEVADSPDPSREDCDWKKKLEMKRKRVKEGLTSVLVVSN